MHFWNDISFYNCIVNTFFINSLQGLEPFREKETAKLLRLVHDALDETGYRLDIEKLSQDFQAEDNKRETLSKAQVITK